jgi:predicted RNase H-like nuclease
MPRTRATRSRDAKADAILEAAERRPMTSRGAAAVGIDVAESRKGLDFVALDRRRTILASQGRLTVEAAARITLSLRPAVVCIDSPSGWATSGSSREAERQLARVGIQSYRTGPDPGDHPFYRWMRVGFEVFARLADVYPLYRGGAVAGTAAEVFPHASACLLAGRLRPTDVPKERFRRQVLTDAGIQEDQLPTPDRVDAALGALTGLLALENAHQAVGDPREGVILLPALAATYTTRHQLGVPVPTRR